MTTGQQIWDLALDYIDDATPAFADATQGLRMVNTALAEIHEMLANAKNSDYFRSETTFAIVSGTEAYSLPADFYKANALYYISSNRRYAIDRWNELEIDGYKDSPISGGSVEMWYTPTFTELSALGDTIDTLVYPGWEDYAALQVAARLAMKEDDAEKYALLSNERDRKRALIVNAMTPRDRFRAEAIADEYGRFESAGRKLIREEKYFKYRISGDNIYFIEVEYLGI